ncbi:MAG: ATP-binding cassette domain-containing protein [Ruminococcaceae bacterium]|nr:ATP-binding cassette domain-containing protein [Oscillospiraceae bacterium]
MIEVTNLTKRYGGCTAVDNVSFKIRNGRIYGLLGPNGAGKSTTMNIITGCLAPTEGTVTVNGYDILENPLEVKRQIGYLPEIPPLFPDMTPYEYLTFVAEAKGVDSDSLLRQVSEVMVLTGIVGVRDRLIKNLSKGYKQRVGIAQTMLGNPDIVILDEPTVGLDPKQIIEIRDLIRRLGEKKTVIVSSHILAEISAVCDHVIIISNGRVVADDDISCLEANVTPTRDISITVKGDMEGVREALLAIDGVSDVAYDSSSLDKTPGAVQLTVTVTSSEDLRDAIFFAMAEKKYAVISMEQKEMSLESIFLSLTDDTNPATDGKKKKKKEVR